jgi:hypothetical protein
MNAMRRRNNYGRGSRWIRAQYPGRCRCGRKIEPGEKALYFPIGRKLSCLQCGHVDAMRISREELKAILKKR